MPSAFALGEGAEQAQVNESATLIETEEAAEAEKLAAEQAEDGQAAESEEARGEKEAAEATEETAVEAVEATEEAAEETAEATDFRSGFPPITSSMPATQIRPEPIFTYSTRLNSGVTPPLDIASESRARSWSSSPRSVSPGTP